MSANSEGERTEMSQEPLDLLDLLRKRGPLSTAEIAATLGLDREVVRKRLERLAEKGRVIRVAKGVYDASDTLPLDLFFLAPELDRMPLPAVRPLLEEAEVEVFRRLIRERWGGERLVVLKAWRDEDPFSQIKAQGTFAANLVVADESSLPLRIKAKLQLSPNVLRSVGVSYNVKQAAVKYAKVRLGAGGVIEEEESWQRPESFPKIPNRSDEVLVHGYGKLIEPPGEYRLTQQEVDIDTAKEVARKVMEYRREDWKLSMLENGLSVASMYSTLGLPALFVADGSILPDNLDPYLDYKSLPQNVLRKLREWRDNNHLHYLTIYDRAIREGIILIGHPKASKDLTLTLECIGKYTEGSYDMHYLTDAMNDGEILLPFKHHRVKKFEEIVGVKVPVYKFYIRREGFLAAPFEIVLPPDYEDKDEFLNISTLLYYLLEADEKHEALAGGEWNKGLATLRQIKWLDKWLEEETAALRTEVDLRLRSILDDFLEKVAELMLRFGLTESDIRLFVLQVMGSRVETAPLRW